MAVKRNMQRRAPHRIGNLYTYLFAGPGSDLRAESICPAAGLLGAIPVVTLRGLYILHTVYTNCLHGPQDIGNRQMDYAFASRAGHRR